MTNCIVSDLVWDAFLDNRYHCKVNRIDQNIGKLIILDDDTVIYSREVTITRSCFGVDLADVERWQDFMRGVH